MNTLALTILLWSLVILAVLALVAFVIAIPLLVSHWKKVRLGSEQAEQRATAMRREFDECKSRVDKALKMPF